MNDKILIYGANGYTGQLIVNEALKQNLNFDVAGRNEENIRAMADKYNIGFKVFGMTNEVVVAQHLEGYRAVIHAAGPFIHTAKIMMKACIIAKVHYMDITGEIPVFELGAKMGSEAKSAGISIIPGCGFDVVPTDCMAAYLKSKLPTATHLQLGFATFGSRVSHGTALTMVENLGKTGAIRQDGKITPVPTAYKGQNIPFKSDKARFAMTIPWGDVSTAWYSTGIPNIETYMSTSPKNFKRMRFMDKYFKWLMKKDIVKNYMRKRIKNMPAGPNEEELENGYVMVWGKVWDEAGNKAEARIKSPEGYKLTALCAVEICKRVVNNESLSGFLTPSLAFGQNLLTEVTGATFEDIA
jgi:short subunit dehydrogenase-like uncharacterized protein